jgi:hypothetical protein
LLGQLLWHNYNGDEHSFSVQEQSGIWFLHHQIYKYNIFQINYTTYDLCRAYDMLNLRTCANFMMLSHEDSEEPETKFLYWFRQIVGIFHTAIIYTGPGSHSVKPQHVEFLFVWWFDHDIGHRGGWNVKQPH